MPPGDKITAVEYQRRKDDGEAVPVIYYDINRDEFREISQQDVDRLVQTANAYGALRLSTLKAIDVAQQVQSGGLEMSAGLVRLGLS